MEYKAEDIKPIDWKDHIRLRPAMYIGSLHVKGIWHMIYEVLVEIFNNSKDEFFIEISLNESQITLHFRFKDTSTHFKYLDKIGIYAGGSSFGIPVLVALSKKCKIDVIYDYKQSIRTAENGNLNDCLYLDTKEKENRIAIDFIIDTTIFKISEFNFDYLCEKIQQFAYTTSNCSFICQDKPTKQLRKFNYKNGLSELFNLEMVESHRPNNKSLFLKSQIDNYEYEICINLNGGKYERDNITFANNFHTTHGGSLESSIQKGVIKAIKKWTLNTLEKNAFKYYKTKKAYLVNDLFIVAGIFGKDFTYYGSTKHKLGMPEIEKKLGNYIYKVVLKHFNDNIEETKNLLENLYIISNDDEQDKETFF